MFVFGVSCLIFRFGCLALLWLFWGCSSRAVVSLRVCLMLACSFVCFVCVYVVSCLWLRAAFCFGLFDCSRLLVLVGFGLFDCCVACL